MRPLTFLTGRQGQKHKRAIILCVCQMLTIIFSCCMQQKDVAKLRGRVPDQGVRRAKPPEAETLLAFGRLMKATNLIFGNAKVTDVCVVLQQ